MEFRGGVAVDSLVARPDEVHRPAHVGAVLGNARGRQWVTREIVEGREELHRYVVRRDQVVDEEVVDVPAEVAEEGEEVAKPGEDVTEGADGALVVASEALESEVETVADPGMDAAGLIDRVRPCTPGRRGRSPRRPAPVGRRRRGALADSNLSRWRQWCGCSAGSCSLGEVCLPAHLRAARRGCGRGRGACR